MTGTADAFARARAEGRRALVGYLLLGRRAGRAVHRRPVPPPVAGPSEGAATDPA